MRIREKPVVFGTRRVMVDMLMLAAQAVVVGAAAALLAGMLVAGVVALMS